MKIPIWAWVVAGIIALGLVGVWLAEDWRGFGIIFAPIVWLINRFFGSDKSMDKIDKESEEDLQNVKKKKKELHETNNVSDLAAELTAGSKRQKRKDTS